ncbi:glycoside hydrolase family 27 protein [Sulfuriroseicoccus oceanibius]|uniref:Alpha-galactosidase n=1 Tax=Sulfuriroseicoccus oceanibius TaxID=2707525 RepID=A0A6B3LD87_9BACT|nr:glycoside hydrolase family 27 protein [Sulfuriroseicoccus oceanibius]QQL44906.1 glycoside hydrolase family 27 protein [Sulfuriroseicoccus oceanibius]
MIKPISIVACGILAVLSAHSEQTSPRKQTPIMGWSSWNHFRIKIDESIIKGQADAMATNGMKEVGYQFINIDDGYFGGRDENGTLFCDPETFPSGMKALASYIHSKGLKAGIYSDAGKDTCGTKWDNDPRGYGVGLLGHDKKDIALMLGDWGYDFLKVDWCSGEWMGLDEETRYTEIGKIVRETNPSAIYNICRWEFPGKWALKVADSWRVSADIAPNFSSICHIIDKCEPLWIHASPGNINDMDMLQVGRGMTLEQDKSHFAMWCMMASPLLAGNDLRSMKQETLEILTNKDLIAINQDPLVYQARKLHDAGDQEVWARPLIKRTDGKVAVALFNRSNQPARISVDLAALGIDPHKGYSIRDCWLQKTTANNQTSESLTYSVPAHGTIVLRISGSNTPQDVFAR